MIWDVVVVGAGIVGLSAALSLAQGGFRVAVLEARRLEEMAFPLPNDPFDIKVVAISRASEKLLHRLGIWSLIEKSGRSCPYQHIKVWDEVADGEIHFSAMDFFESNLGHIIEQRVILAALWQGLKQYPEIKVFTGEALGHIEKNNQYVDLYLKSGAQLKASLLIGADGAQSCVRNLCQIESEGWAYHQSAIIATIEGEKSHNETAFQRFASDGPCALLPLSEPSQSSIVWTTSPKEAASLCEMPSKQFNEILTRESSNVMGKIRVISDRVAIPLFTHHVKHYATERCVLVGDAAHTLHPLAGQGVNLGLLDVVALSERLINTQKKGRDIGGLRVLKAYERERRFHNQMMIWAMELFKRGFSSQSGCIQRWRNIGLSWVDNQLMIKTFFVKCAMGNIKI